jgi:hypothetical protein
MPKFRVDLHCANGYEGFFVFSQEAESASAAAQEALAAIVDAKKSGRSDAYWHQEWDKGKRFAAVFLENVTYVSVGPSV